MILENWKVNIRDYDKAPKGDIYNRSYSILLKGNNRKSTISSLLTNDFFVQLVHFLKDFGMAKTMGKESANLNNPKSFINRLKIRIESISGALEILRKIPPEDFNPKDYRDLVFRCYSSLAEKSKTGLDSRNYTDPEGRTFAFDVGATKILHAILPWHLIIIDKYTAFSLQHFYPNEFSYNKNYPTGHNFDKYMKGLIIAKIEVQNILEKQNTDLWNNGLCGLPPFRIFDKCSWIKGKRIENKKC